MIRPIAILVAILLTLGACGPRVPQADTAEPAAKPAIDVHAGAWEMDVIWSGQPANGAKHWHGTMTLSRDPSSSGYTGTLVLRCTDVRWVVTQEVAVTFIDGTMKVVGSNVEELEKPADGGGYGYDVFEVEERNGLWFSGDASGEHAGSGSVTIFKAGGPA